MKAVWLLLGLIIMVPTLYKLSLQSIAQSRDEYKISGRPTITGTGKIRLELCSSQDVCQNILLAGVTAQQKAFDVLQTILTTQSIEVQSVSGQGAIATLPNGNTLQEILLFTGVATLNTDELRAIAPSTLSQWQQAQADAQSDRRNYWAASKR